jgi:Domain of unknown function (DUF397)
LGDLSPCPLVWRKSSRSNSGNCVEVAATSTAVFVRDSKDPGGPVLQFGCDEWSAFLTAVKSDEFTA